MNLGANKQTPNSSKYHATEELESFEKDLVFYNTYIVQKFLADFTSHANKKNIKPSVLDFGAGIGALADIWVKESESTKPICLEIDEKQRQIISEKGYMAIKSIDLLTEKVDFIYSSNVLEHIADDVEVLIELNKFLNEDGLIAIYVPAFQYLFSDLDRKAGHYRRYSKHEIKSKLSKAGFNIEKINYVDSVGFFAAYALRLLGWRKIGDLGSSKSLQFYDKFIFPISKSLDWLGFQKLFGKNLYVLAKKVEK